MKKSFKSKALGLSALALGGAVLPNVTGCKSPTTSTTQFFTVKAKDLEVEFCDMGASIYSIKYNDTYLTYHPKDKEVFADKGATPYYYGKTLGRVAGRFGDGEFTLDGAKHHVQINETGATKNNCLHGGKDAFSFKNFTHYVREDSVNNCKTVAFNYFSPANEAGFPEALDVWVVYKLYTDKNRIDTDLYAIPTGKTVINLSTHSLFRLANSGGILDYELTIPTATRAEYDKESEKKTGQVVVGTKSVTEDDGVFNFQTAKAVGKDMQAIKEKDPVSGGIDHIWVFDRTTAVANRYVQLKNPANGITFKVTANTDSVDGFIIYTNCYPRKGQIMSDGQEDTQYAGITVEPYTYFTKTNIDPITYTPDKPFHNGFIYEISEE